MPHCRVWCRLHVYAPNSFYMLLSTTTIKSLSLSRSRPGGCLQENSYFVDIIKATPFECATSTSTSTSATTIETKVTLPTMRTSMLPRRWCCVFGLQRPFLLSLFLDFLCQGTKTVGNSKRDIGLLLVYCCVWKLNPASQFHVNGKELSAAW